MHRCIQAIRRIACTTRASGYRSRIAGPVKNASEYRAKALVRPWVAEPDRCRSCPSRGRARPWMTDHLCDSRTPSRSASTLCIGSPRDSRSEVCTRSRLDRPQPIEGSNPSQPKRATTLAWTPSLEYQAPHAPRRYLRDRGLSPIAARPSDARSGRYPGTPGQGKIRPVTATRCESPRTTSYLPWDSAWSLGTGTGEQRGASAPSLVTYATLRVALGLVISRRASRNRWSAPALPVSSETEHRFAGSRLRSGPLRAARLTYNSIGYARRRGHSHRLHGAGTRPRCRSSCPRVARGSSSRSRPAGWRAVVGGIRAVAGETTTTWV